MFTVGSPGAIIAQALLVALLLGAILLVVRVLRGRGGSRTAPLAALTPEQVADLTDALPQLETQQRVSAPVVRVLPSAGETALPLVELRLGRRPLIFTPIDLQKPNAAARYETAAAKDAPPSDVALFALCALEEGGANTMREQIKDFDKVKDAAGVVRLLPAQTQAGDYIVIARVLSHRRDDVSEGMPVIVYRAETIKNADTQLIIELAVPDDGQTPFADGAMVHGTARMYGYLP
ncbi:MAG: hypothetical protein H7Y38_20255 [Armatimonadetes bacterium]|nr:hypothetical protein [Armatimonadota bacterium]